MEPFAEGTHHPIETFEILRTAGKVETRYGALVLLARLTRVARLTRLAGALDPRTAAFNASLRTERYHAAAEWIQMSHTRRVRDILSWFRSLGPGWRATLAQAIEEELYVELVPPHLDPYDRKRMLTELKNATEKAYHLACQMPAPGAAPHAANQTIEATGHHRQFAVAAVRRVAR